MILPIPNIGPCLGMIAQFFGKGRRRSAESPNSNKQKWRGWKDWQDDAYNSEANTEPAQTQIKQFHRIHRISVLHQNAGYSNQDP